MSEKLAIMYLTDDGRHFYFEHFIDSICKMKNRDNIVILILTHCNDLEFYDSIMKSKNFSNYIIQYFNPHDNYMNKVRFAIDFSEKNSIKYIAKHDNDIFMSSYLYDYIFDNLSILNNTDNFVLTPTLTSGIPSIEYFLDDFASESEQLSIRNNFNKFSIPNIWGADYSSLNNISDTWNYRNFYNSVSQINHHYKGIHPHRISHDLHNQLNDIVLNHKNEIMIDRSFTLFYDKESPYLCNSIFFIRTDMYRDVISHTENFVDSFEEVPLNKKIKQLNANIVFVRNGAAIHPFYNCVENNRTYEEQFLKQFFS
jgi:hypothetical protein